MMLSRVSEEKAQFARVSSQRMQSCRRDELIRRNVLYECSCTEPALNVIRRSMAMARVSIEADPGSMFVTAMAAT